ncbi:hypothetical protein TIFTF001_015597 [Ficus carica]|uniref:Uncharacterized protein n=1 Tax=Ficus carica TaxID=3494 RepID=A0AA88DIP0_FICCA|nr:hypothetical protein TIFTF001_015597 [Ficus carica]
MDGHDADDTKQSTADMTAFGRAYDTRCEDELKNQIMKKLVNCSVAEAIKASLFCTFQVQNLLQQMIIFESAFAL